MVGNLAGGLCHQSYRESLNLASESGPESNWDRDRGGGGLVSRSQRAPWRGPSPRYPTQCLGIIPPPTLNPFLILQSGGGTVPPMKVVTPGASRLKAAQSQAGSPDKGKHGKQRAEYMRIQAQQQVRWAPWEQDPPPPPPCHSAMYSCCVLGISCHCSCDQLLPAAQRGLSCQD